MAFLGARVQLALLALAMLLHGAASAKKPHIITIMIDDWGYNNWGVHAKDEANSREVRTPSLDALANVGIVLDRHYAAPLCTPSRAAFQTGRNPMHVIAVNGDAARYNPADPVSGFDGIPTAMTGIASKMASAGYNTHFLGKWHIGYASRLQLPKARGYKKSLAYLCSGNKYWTYEAQFGICGAGAGPTLTDLWQDDGPAIDLKPAAGCANGQANCVYEDELLEQRATQWIKAHDASEPLFMVYAPHALHSPLDPPAARVADFAFIKQWSRQMYAATLADIDMRIGRIIQTVKDKGLWDNALILVMSDNGGPISVEGGASNFPLRGGKYGNFEGGVRTNAFVSGGFVPAAQRGTTVDGFVAVEDWFSTFCALAGVDPTDTKAQKAGLPPIDSINVWPYLSGLMNTSPRKEIILANTNKDANGTKVQGIIDQQGNKLLAGMIRNAVNSPAINPTGTQNDLPKLDCGPPGDPRYPYDGACLFNVFSDPSELTNIAAQKPAVVARLAERLKAIQATAFSAERGDAPNDKPSGLPCQSALRNLSGFEGPWLDMPFSTKPRPVAAGAAMAASDPSQAEL
ncbi:arylsulfatase B-like protein [Tribonema minus]|uniref:Arylsulfatase B-like protein n=1 Tax=Tribonema minus TaxID=303371 RepID=A0A836CMP8_9STRA|nr:arylsulfatase B-like protein [Tribonema minus]